jgi:hypothetical protein
MTTISIEAIKILSPSYDAQHGITQHDADKASELHAIIEATRNPDKPMSGDIMICIGPHREYFSGHIAEDDLSALSAVCVQPYVPFVFKRLPAEIPQVSFDTSGGYWFSIPKPLHAKVKYIGQRDKLFKAWGHCGACADGAFTFSAEVNVWIYGSDTIY